jgi:predicted dehydrogenase
MNRKLRMGMVGGGRDALIGPLHRAAAQADGSIELVAGAFSSTRPKSKDSGADLGLPPERVYGVYRDMLRAEAKRPADEQIDFISIVTPSNMHYPVAMAALDAGFHVLCETPMTTTVDEAENLARKLEQTGKLFCLTQHHAGYPLVAEARELVTSGKLGAVRRVVVEYPQGWLATRIEAKGQKQAAWRTNPRNSGGSCCMSDVGVHAEGLAATITGLTISEVCADLSTFVNGRMLEDDGTVLLRYEEGAKGVLWATQVAIGDTSGLRIRVYGEKGTLSWRRSDPNKLTVFSEDGQEETKVSPPSEVEDEAPEVLLPPGHPEVHVAPLAALYRSFAETLIQSIDDGKVPPPESLNFPGVREGIRSARFTAAAVASATSKEKWVEV